MLTCVFDTTTLALNFSILSYYNYYVCHINYDIYSKIFLEFYVDPNPIQWKKKIVFSK